MKRYFQNATTFYKKHEGLLMPAALLFGFVVDVITFRSIQIQTALLVLFIHAMVVLFSIAILASLREREDVATKKWLAFISLITPFLFQVSLGALLSAAFIFYTFSGALSVSWPVLALVGILMIANERSKGIQQNHLVQFSVLYFALFLVLSVALPFIYTSIHPVWFFLSGVLAFAFVWGYILLLGKRIEQIRSKEKKMLTSMAIIFGVMSGFYVLNIIPPVPLSLYHADVYHNVERSGNDYRALKEQQSIWERLKPGKRVNVANGERVYVFTSIVAPGDLNTRVVHDWQRLNEQAGDWESQYELSYPIVGGRAEGYRGFSFSRMAESGKWRVQVETVHGQIIGREVFTVVRTEDQPELASLIIE